MSPVIPQEQQPYEVHEFVDAMVHEGWETVFVRPSDQAHWRCEFTRGDHRVQLLYGRIADAWSVVEPKPSPWTGAEEVLHLIERRYPKSAIPQEQRPLIDRMREAVPELEWCVYGDGAIGKLHSLEVVSANPHTSLLCWRKRSSEPHAVNIPYPGDDEAVRIVSEWWVKTHPQPARDPITERGERLKALLPMLEWTPGTDAGNSLWLARDMHTEVVTIGSDWVTAFTRRQGRKHRDAIDQAHYTTDDELISLLTKWRDATYPQQSSRTEALVEAIRRECPEANAYSDDEAVRVFWNGAQWRFVPDGEHWQSVDTHCTQRGIVREIRSYIDTYTLAEDQTLEGLTQQSRCTAWSGERTVTEAELATLKREEEARAKPASDKRTITVSMSSTFDPKGFEEAVARGLEHAQKRGHTPESIITGAPTMDTKTLTQTIKVDASEAAWRTAGSQFVKLAREPLVGLLTRHLAPGDDAFRARLAAFLETELGTALLASVLSASLSAMPQTTGDVPQKLARELRVRAMADAGDVLADVLMGPLRQVMALYLQDPQGAPQLGVAQTTAVDFAGVGAKEGVR